MLVPAGPQDVIPGRRLVALKTLVDSCVRFARNTSRDHLEVPHIMAGWRLMALGAVQGRCRRVAEFRNRPAIGGVALRAILTIEFEVAVIVGMAGAAVENRFLGCDVNRR